MFALTIEAKIKKLREDKAAIHACIDRAMEANQAVIEMATATIGRLKAERTDLEYV